MKTYDTVIIGGGAAGLMSAAFCSKKTLIIERNPELGLKILKTGNGRCNITNSLMSADEYVRYKRDDYKKDFISKVLSKFSYNNTTEFFKSIGVPTVNINGYIYPYSKTATSVRNALIKNAEKCDVETMLNSFVSEVKKADDGEYIITVKQKKDTLTISARKVIITTGGKAAPISGSDGNGFDIARKFGHSIVQSRPALTALIADDENISIASGVRAKAGVSVLKVNQSNEEKICSEEGEVQFCDYGLSGISLFQVSSVATDILEDKTAEVLVELNLFTDFNDDEIYKLAAQWFSTMPDRNLRDFFGGIIPAKLVTMIARRLGISMSKKVSQLGIDRVNAFIKEATALRVKIDSVKGFDFAQVSSGGVCLEEINPETMESELSKGLYFAGEVVDVDGPCGGYNLQWAWSSAVVAARG